MYLALSILGFSCIVAFLLLRNFNIDDRFDDNETY